jgi:hypothetical protein
LAIADVTHGAIEPTFCFCGGRKGKRYAGVSIRKLDDLVDIQVGKSFEVALKKLCDNFTGRPL